MTNYKVEIDVRYTFDVSNATSMDDALTKATYFQKTMKVSWGDNSVTDNVSWIDSYTIKRTVSQDTDLK